MQRHALAAAALMLLAGCIGGADEGGDAQADAPPPSLEGMGAGEQRVFPVEAAAGQPVRIDVEIKRTSAEHSRVVVDFRDGDTSLEARDVYLGSIGGIGEMTQESLVASGDDLQVVASVAEGAAEVSVSSTPVEPQPATTVGGHDANATAA